MAKELKEKCHQGGSFHHGSSFKKTSGNNAGGLSAFSSEEEQFLKFFVDDVWETRVKQMMLIRSLFLYLDRTTATAFTKNASIGLLPMLLLTPQKKAAERRRMVITIRRSPLDDDERRRRSGTDAVTTTTTTPGSRERSSKESSFKLPLWELSVQQFQKQMDANADVLRKAASGCLRLIEREREGEKIDRTLVKRFTTAMETLKRYGGGSNNSFSSSSFPSATKFKALGRRRRRRRSDDDGGRQQKTTINTKINTTYVGVQLRASLLRKHGQFYAKESDKRFGITKSQRRSADYLKHCQTRLSERSIGGSYLQPQANWCLQKRSRKR